MTLARGRTLTQQHETYLALKAGRIMRGWTQAQMAELMAEATGSDEWTEPRITAIETGRKRVGDDDLRTFAEVQGYSSEFYWYGPEPHRKLREIDRAKGLSLKPEGHNKWADWALMLKADHLAEDLDQYGFDHTGRLVHKSWLVADLQDERLPIFEAA